MGLIPDLGRPYMSRTWAHVPQLSSLRFRASKLQLLKPEHPGAHALQQEEASQREAPTRQPDGSPRSAQLQEGLHGNKDPAKPKISK